MTDLERAVCREFSGCHKCRRLFIDHKSLNCPNDYPDGHNYKPLTREMGIQLATQRAIASTYSQPISSSPHLLARAAPCRQVLPP